MKILLLEDDISLNKAIKKVLELDYHIVYTFTDGQELIDSLDQSYDLYILDINVPHISGLELLDMILLQNDQAKVIMISSNTDVQSIQTAYNSGCVDYLKKPFHIAELRAKTNRLKMESTHLLSGVKFKSEDDTLSKKERRLLKLLLSNLSLIVTYEMIEHDVYENKRMSMDAIRALVRRLRTKLADDIIENIIDVGYTISNVPALSNTEPEKNINQRVEALEQENNLLKLEKEILLKRSTTDPLTGLYNRVKIKEMFLYEQQRFIRHGDVLSVILLDLDNFKFINDTYGHNVGDNYLKELAGILTGFFRTVDIVGRWGGEEFLILLPKTSLGKSRYLALRLKELINKMECPMIAYQTASFGVATLNDNDTLSTLVNRADKALFRAKASGKDRVEIVE